MPAVALLDAMQPRRADNNERFVAFTFAGAEMVAEIQADETITYAAGSFRIKFGRSPENFVGQSVRDLVSSVDHEALDAALALLLERGRLLPFIIRLANSERSCLALAGLVLPPRVVHCACA